MVRKFEVIRTFRVLGDVRGETNEKTALEALINHVERERNKNLSAYPWLSTIRPKTPDEDRVGVDIVFETSKGNYGINVKSSYRFAWEHEERFPDIPVLIVDERTNLEEAAKNIILEIYNKFYKKNSSGNF